MHSIYRYLIKITGCLGLWIMIFPAPGMGYDSVSGKLPSTVNSGRPADGRGKIVMLKLAAESPKKPLQLPGDLRTQQPPPAKVQLQLNRSKRAPNSASAQTQAKRSESNPTQQPVARPQSVDIAAPINAPALPEVEPIAEPPAIQEPIVTEPLMPAAGQSQLLTDIHPQPLNDDVVPPVGKKDDNIHTAAIKPGPEYAQPLDSIHDTVGIIARLLLKFSLITVCCIALFFSFSALQIAKTNQRIRYRTGEENNAR